MTHFKILKDPYFIKIPKAGIYVDELIYIKYKIVDTDTGVLFFKFNDNKKKYLTDQNIECIPKLEPYKYLLVEIFRNLEESKNYSYDEVLTSFIRNHKINSIIENDD